MVAPTLVDYPSVAGRPRARRIVRRVSTEGRHGQEPVQLVTSAPESLRDEQAHRIHRYLWTMGIRTFSFVAAVVTQGWVRWTFVALAVFLPYIAVVAANAVRPRALGSVASPQRPSRRRLLGR